MEALRPARVCVALLAALEASEGRSRSRKRDQVPDAIGMALRRELLRGVVRDDPEPGAFEQWLLDSVEDSAAPGATCAVARVVLEEWRLAHRMEAFALWLERGAPSEDAVPPDREALGRGRATRTATEPAPRPRVLSCVPPADRRVPGRALSPGGDGGSDDPG